MRKDRFTLGIRLIRYMAVAKEKDHNLRVEKNGGEAKDWFPQCGDANV